MMEITSLLAQFALDENNQPRKLDGSKAELRNGYLKTQSMVREAQNDKGDGVDFTAHGHTKAPHWFSGRHNEFSQSKHVISNLDFQGRSVLDIGAGTGFDASRFNSMGAKVTALEYSPLQSAIGAENFPEIDWIGGSVTHLPFPDESFDFVVANAALHHVFDLEAALDEMIRVLKVGGHMLTMADSFGPNHFTESDEVMVFNSHPAVLRGVNEQVPRLSRFLSPLEAHSDRVSVEVMTSIVHGLHKRTDEMRLWTLEEASEVLSGYRSGICTRVRKDAATHHRQKPVEGELVPFESYVSSLKDRRTALSQLARCVPDWAVDCSIVDTEQPKFRLVLGWRRQVASLPYREAAAEAHLFVTDDFLRTELPRITFRVPKANGAETRTICVSINGREICRQSIAANQWSTLNIDLSRNSIDLCPRNLLTLNIDGFEGDIFQVSTLDDLRQSAAIEFCLVENSTALQQRDRGLLKMSFVSPQSSEKYQ